MLWLRMSQRNISWLSAYLIALALALEPGLFLQSGLQAGDWPQILGPQRNGIAEDETLADRWPASGPKVVWDRPVGHGWAGLAVVGERAVLFHRLQDQEVVEALDAGTGQVAWTQSFPSRYKQDISGDNGPRCVPLIHAENVYVYGAEGKLRALTLADGKVLWERDTQREYSPPGSYFGAGSTPIVVGDKLLVNVGGRGASIVAFDLQTGKTVWKAFDDAPSYSSPTAATIDNQQHVFFVTRLHALSLDPENGTVRFKFRFGAPGPTVNAANPLVRGDRLFLTANYGVGAVMASVQGNDFSTVWENDSSLSSQYCTAIWYKDHLYGIDGGENIGADTTLRCIEPATGKIVWQQPCGNGSLLLAGDKLLLLDTEGKLTLIRAQPKSYQELASAQVLSGTTRPLPALSNGRLFVRDTEQLKCLLVK